MVICFGMVGEKLPLSIRRMRVAFCDMAQKRWKVLSIDNSFCRIVLVITNNYGKDKGFNQIADLPDSYIFADDIESPIGAKLPLWMLGFLY